MADPRFFTVGGPFTLEKIAAIAGAELGAGAAPDKVIVDVAPLETAGPEHLSFLDNPRYVEAFAASRAGACLVRPAHVGRAPGGMALLIALNPYRSYARAARAFYPEAEAAGSIHASAVVDPTAAIGQGSVVEAGVVIGARAALGRRCRVGPNAVLGPGVVLGDDVVVGAGCSLSHCLVGSRVVFGPGARVGQPGFGFAMGEGGHTRVPQLGRVIIEDDVEIGANSTVDRGAGPDTVIGRGSMIDNLVQIAHNVRLGKGCVVVAQAGVAGSTVLEDDVVLAAQAGLIGHLRIGRSARVGAQSGIMRDIPAGATVQGSPGVPSAQHWRQVAILQRLAKRKGP